MLRPLGDILIVHHKGEFGPSYLAMLGVVLMGCWKECGATTFKNEDMKKKVTEKFEPDPRIDEFDFGAIAEYVLSRSLAGSS